MRGERTFREKFWTVFFDNRDMTKELPRTITLPSKESIESILTTHPLDWRAIAERMAALPMVYVAALIVVGFAFLVSGYKINKLPLPAFGVVAGVYLGILLAQWLGLNPFIVALISAVVLGLLAIPLQKICFFVGGGVIGVLFLSPSLALVFHGLIANL